MLKVSATINNEKITQLATDMFEAQYFVRSWYKKGYPAKIEEATIIPFEEGLELIDYPAWLYKFAYYTLADMDDAATALCDLPFMKDKQVRDRLESRLYSDIPYGSETYKNMARKAWEAHLFIERVLKNHSKPVICSSMGKDSMVVMHLVLMHDPNNNTHILFNDTRCEHPATYELMRRVKVDWKLNLVTTQPEMTYWDIQAKYGWPTKGRGVGDKASEECCKQLKKLPTKKALKEYGWDLSFLGLNKNESWQRKVSGEKYGSYFYSRTWKIWRAYPIHDWTQNEIWDYIIFWQLPVSEVYRPLPANMDRKEALEKFRMYPHEPEKFHWEDMTVVQKYVPGYVPRTGCAFCSIGIKHGKLGYYRYFFPKLYNILVLKRGLGLHLLKQNCGKGEIALFPVTEKEVQDTIEIRPCAFDYA